MKDKVFYKRIEEISLLNLEINDKVQSLINDLHKEGSLLNRRSEIDECLVHIISILQQSQKYLQNPKRMDYLDHR